MILHAPLQLLGFDGLISLEAGNLILAVRLFFQRTTIDDNTNSSVYSVTPVYG